MDQDEKREDITVDGLVVELQHLEACERGLAAAYDLHQRHAAHGPGLGQLADCHRRHAQLLAARLVALGAQPFADADDEWVPDPKHFADSLIYAEHACTRTYHDHLTDFDVETMALIRNRILPEQESLLTELTGEPAQAGFSMEP